MTDQPTPTPRTDAEVEELSDERLSDLDAYMRMTKHARELERELRWQRDYWESVPSGADYEADEDDECPDDTVAHMAGIAIRRINRLLKP